MAANWNLSQVLNQLDSGRKWTGSTITYAFPTGAGGLFSQQGEAGGFRATNAAQQALMTLALATWDDLIPQSFVPGTVGSTAIEFGYTSTGIGYAHAYYPTVGSAWFNVNESSLTTTALGQYGFQTFVHEIGHALGLNHMGDYNGDGNWSPSSFQDSVVLSIMSYFGPRYAAPNYSAEVMQADWVAADGQTYSPQTPMVNDIHAIQTMYGVSTTTRSGDTVYGFNSTVTGSTAQIYDFSRNATPILTLFDSGGIDTLDLSGWATPSRIDLTPGAFSSANAMTNNIAMAYSTTIENARGGSASDVLRGNDVANRLEGGAGDDELSGGTGDDVLVGGPGNDTLDGGAGTDTAIFENPFASYGITLAANTVIVGSASNGTDRVTGVERFQFSDGVRTLEQLAPGSDSTAPLLTSLSPADNSGGVAPGSQLVLNFNEAMKAGSGTLSIFNADGSLWRSVSVTDTTQLRFSGSTVTLDPAVDLTAGRSYYVNISAGALTDMAGNGYTGLAGSTAWNFSVASADTTAPRVLSLSPGDDSSNVTPGASLVMQFDEPVRAGSGNIVIRQGTTLLRSIAVTDSSQVSINGSTVTIDPAVDLPAGAAISISVDAGALRDATGNAFAGISGSTAWNFGVSSAPVTDDFPYSTATTGVVGVDGAAVVGHIEVRGDQDLLRVDLVGGISYAIALQRTGSSGLSDPYVGLFDPSLNLVGEDDDSGGSGNALLGYTPTVSGSFYIAVLDYADGTGRYSVQVTRQDRQAPTVLSLTPADETGSVSLGADLVIRFSETVQRGTGAVRVLDANGAVLREIQVDDANAVRITGSTVTVDPGANLPADARLTVQVDSGAFQDVAGNAFAGISGGTGWNFRTVAPPADDYPLSTNTTGVLAINGSALSARIESPNDGDLFRVTLSAGITYRFDMVSPSNSFVDPYLALYGPRPEVELLSYDDDSGPLPLDARLYYTPTVSGDYYLAAFDYAEQTGVYSVSVATPSDDYSGNNTGRLIVAGAPASARIDAPSDSDTFAITLTQGQLYTFDLVSTGLDDPYLILLDNARQPLAFDDDKGSGFNSALTFLAPSSGTYFLTATDFGSGTGSYQLSAFVRTVLRGSAAADTLTGGNAAESLQGDAGPDRLRGNGGNDILDGGDGIDTAVLSGPGGRYTLEPVDDGWKIEDTRGTDGRDLTVGVERLAFSDQLWALDLDGNAGITVLTLGAVFGPASVSNREYVGIGLALLDAGMSEQALMALALEARLGPNPSRTAVVNLLYSNVTGVLPSTADRLMFEGLLANGTYTPASLGQLAATTDLNIANVDLVGLLETGIGYIG